MPSEQVAGVGDMLARAGVTLPQETVRIGVSVPGWARGGLRALGTHGPRGAVQPMIGALHDFSALPSTPPALILGSGGTSAWALRYLGWKTGAPTGYIGPWAPFPRGWFTLALSPDSDGAGEVATDFLVSRMTPRRATEAAIARFGAATPGHWAMMIGGRSRSHHFDADDWTALADGINASARAHGIRWLVSTSARTGEAAEAILDARLDRDAVADLVLWGRKPDKCAAAYLGAAERVFVTRDSLTMLSEAVASGRPTVAVAPRASHLDPGFFADMLARLRGQGWMEETTCHALSDAIPQGGGIGAKALHARETRITALFAPYLKELAP